MMSAGPLRAVRNWPSVFIIDRSTLERVEPPLLLRLFFIEPGQSTATIIEGDGSISRGP